MAAVPKTETDDPCQAGRGSNASGCAGQLIPFLFFTSGRCVSPLAAAEFMAVVCARHSQSIRAFGARPASGHPRGPAVSPLPAPFKSLYPSNHPPSASVSRWTAVRSCLQACGGSPDDGGTAGVDGPNPGLLSYASRSDPTRRPMSFRLVPDSLVLSVTLSAPFLFSPPLPLFFFCPAVPSSSSFISLSPSSSLEGQRPCRRGTSQLDFYIPFFPDRRLQRRSC